MHAFRRQANPPAEPCAQRLCDQPGDRDLAITAQAEEIEQGRGCHKQMIKRAYPNGKITSIETLKSVLPDD